VLELLTALFSVVKHIAVSSAECESGFSVMNLIITDTRCFAC
jgi:hypothetical protein